MTACSTYPVNLKQSPTKKPVFSRIGAAVFINFMSRAQECRFHLKGVPLGTDEYPRCKRGPSWRV